MLVKELQIDIVARRWDDQVAASTDTVRIDSI